VSNSTLDLTASTSNNELRRKDSSTKKGRE